MLPGAAVVLFVGVLFYYLTNEKVKADVMLDCVENLCYLGDLIGARGVEEACRNVVKNAWMSFNKLGPILTARGVSLRLKENLTACRE